MNLFKLSNWLLFTASLACLTFLIFQGEDGNMLGSEDTPKIVRDSEKADELLIDAWVKYWKYAIKRVPEGKKTVSIRKGGKAVKESDVISLDISSLDKADIVVGIVITFDEFSFSKSKTINILLTATDGKKKARSSKVIENPFKNFDGFIISDDIDEKTLSAGLIATDSSGVFSSNMARNELYLRLMIP